MRTNVRYTLLVIIWLVCVGVAGIGALELTARYVWQHKYNECLTCQLHGYDSVDFQRSIVLPTPNTVMTVAQYRQELKAHQKPLGQRYLECSLADEPLPDSAVLFTIN